MKRIAICYDFDKTLTPIDMQAQGFVQDLGVSIDDFWEDVDTFSEMNNIELNLTYMFKMLSYTKNAGRPLTKQYLNSLGGRISFFDGLDDWFLRINEYAKSRDVQLEHFVISSGVKEIIEGTPIAKHFKKIYASSFHYENGEAVWPAHVVNYTNKTQYIFRISKGVFGELDMAVNDLFEADKFYIPLTNFVYIGDSDTDVPCMKIVTQYGGEAIGVFDKKSLDKRKVEKMLKEKRISHYACADFSAGSELDTLIKNVVDLLSSK